MYRFGGFSLLRFKPSYEKQLMIKGIFLHIFSRVCFVLGSYAMHFFLGHHLTESAYGIVGTVLTIMNFEYIFFTDGVRQAMSRALSAGRFREGHLIRRGALFQFWVVFGFFVFTWFGAPIIAGALGDVGLTPHIRNLAFLLPFTGFYSLMLGILNGRKAFAQEAGVSSIYPFLKLSVIPAVLFFFDDSPVTGVLAGFLFAAVCVTFISLVLVRKVLRKGTETGAGDEKIRLSYYAKIAVGYLILFSSSTFMMNLDTLILKRVSGDDALVGYYTGVVNFAKIPYYLLTACYTVALPIISSCYEKGELKEAADKIGDILTLILSYILPVIVVVAAASGHILSVFYKPAYGRAGGDALSFLIFGVAFIGMLLFFSTVLSGADKRKEFLFASVFSLIFQGVLCYILTGLLPVTGTAFATFIAAGAGMLIAGYFARRTFGGFVRRIHLLLLGGQLLLLIVYMLLFRFVIGEVGFFTLVFICGGMFGIALIPGLIQKTQDRGME